MCLIAELFVYLNIYTVIDISMQSINYLRLPQNPFLHSNFVLTSRKINPTKINTTTVHTFIVYITSAGSLLVYMRVDNGNILRYLISA